MTTALKIHGVDAKAAAEALDKEIRTNIKEQSRGFAKIGLELRDMNLSGGFELLGFETWEDYLRTLQDISISSANQYIRGALVIECFESHQQKSVDQPANLNQALTLATGVADFMVAKRKGGDGNSKRQGGVPSLSRVANPDKVVALWDTVVEKHQAAVSKAEEKGTKPPKLSATRIRQYMPAGNRNRFPPPPKFYQACDPFDSWLRRINVQLASWDDQEFPDEKIKQYIKGEVGKGWDQQLLDGWRKDLKDWERCIQEIREVLSNARVSTVR